MFKEADFTLNFKLLLMVSLWKFNKITTMLLMHLVLLAFVVNTTNRKELLKDTISMWNSQVHLNTIYQGIHV